MLTSKHTPRYPDGRGTSPFTLWTQILFTPYGSVVLHGGRDEVYPAHDEGC